MDEDQRQTAVIVQVSIKQFSCIQTSHDLLVGFLISW